MKLYKLIRIMAISTFAAMVLPAVVHAATYSGGKWNSLSAAGTLSAVLDSQSNILSGVAIAFSSSGSAGLFPLSQK